MGLLDDVAEPIVQLEATCSSLIHIESIDLFCQSIHTEFEVFPIHAWFPAMKVSSVRASYASYSCSIVTSNRADSGTDNSVLMELIDGHGT